MSRERKSIHKISRRLGFSVLESGKEFAKGKKRTYAPGQHGQRRRKLSGFGLQLTEKQKLRHLYGVSEKQFRNTFDKANKLKGMTGINFLVLLEARLDNVAFRMGLAPTRRGTRQIVNHGHILVNGRKLDIPSYSVQIGDVISLKEKAQKNKVTAAYFATSVKAAWLKMDLNKFSAEFTRVPERKELNTQINEAMIVEFYSR